MKRMTYCVILTTVVYIFWSSLSYKNYSVGKKIERHYFRNLKITYEHLNEVIDENDALKHKPCTEEDLAANGFHSVLKLDSPTTMFTIGDKVYVTAKLFDGLGNKKYFGGDVIRAKIWNKENNLSAPGAVIDHHNGQYTLIFECHWNGTTYISATIAYTREAATAIYRLVTEGLALYHIEAKYKSENIEDEVLCFPDKDKLLAVTYYTQVCNFTTFNSGMPWFCGKSRRQELTCSDLKFIRHKWPYMSPTMTSCEQELLYNRIHQPIKSVVRIYIKGLPINQDITPCFKFNTTKLWFRKHTTGFFKNGRWQLTHCKGFVPDKSSKCLKNKHLYMLGDSTVRQWYNVLTERYNCIEKRSKKWKKSMECYAKNLNFTITFKRHSLPYYPGVYWMNPEMINISIPRVLKSIPSHEDAIVLIHIFLHMRVMHPRYFKYKVKVIRLAIESLIQRNKRVRIFIKMPHTFKENFRECNDFFAYIYIRIINEIFTGLYDKVIVLDNRDATNAVESEYMHPDTYIVEGMVDQMLGYICEN